MSTTAEMIATTTEDLRLDSTLSAEDAGYIALHGVVDAVDLTVLPSDVQKSVESPNEHKTTFNSGL